MSVDRFELQQREYQEKGAYHFSDLTLETAEGIEARAKLELTLNTIIGSNPKLVADFGCGEGVLVRSLKSKAIACIGLDLSGNALQLAPPEIKESLIQADLEQIPLKDSSVDVAAMIAILEHIPSLDIPNILKEVRRVIRKGGKLVVRVPSTNQSLQPKHYQHFTEDHLQEVLSSSGFTVEQIIGNHNTSLDWYNYYSKMGQDSYEVRYSFYQETFAICDPANAKRLLAVGINT